ncbi:MAG TPA: hypothetical protein VEC58_09870 [Roseiarcus sp.]|nr:hypothetical protein [Roseiarcus sp.]
MHEFVQAAAMGLVGLLAYAVVLALGLRMMFQDIRETPNETSRRVLDLPVRQSRTP